MKPKIELIAVDKLIPYINNARVHNDDQVLQIAASIKEFGFNNPVLVDKDNGIIAGHGRVMAAKKLEQEQVPCIRIEHLTDAQRKAYILADNKIALNAKWDTELLKMELDHLVELGMDVQLTGFSELDLQKIDDDRSQRELREMSEDGAGSPDDPDDDSENPMGSEFVPISVMVEHDHRQVIFDAMRVAKSKHSLDTSGQALWVICKEFVSHESV